MSVPTKPPTNGGDNSSEERSTPTTPQLPQKPARPSLPELSKPAEDVEVRSFRGQSMDDIEIAEEKQTQERLKKISKINSTKAKKTTLFHSELTSEDLLVNPWGRYEHLTPKVVEVKAWLTEVLSQQSRTSEIAEARLERGKKYDEMYALIESLLTRYFLKERVVSSADSKILMAMVANELLGLGPIEPLWRDDRISEIMVNGPYKIRVEMGGRLMDVPGARFRNAEHLVDVCQQILAPINRAVDVAHPLQDGSLVDGSRVNIVHPSVGSKGPYVTIRRFPDTVFSLKQLIAFGSMNTEMAEDIGNYIAAGLSSVIIGGTGSGKLLSLDTCIPTPTGMTTMGDLKVGDVILDENTLPTIVTAKYSNKVPVAYQLTFSDGNTVMADEDHNWFTSTRSARRAVSRQETSAKHRDAARKSFASDDELAALQVLYNERAELISPSDIFKTMPRFRTIVYNASKALTPVSRTKTHTFYDAKDLISLVIENSSRLRNDQRSKSALESVVTTKEIFDSLRTPTGHTNHAVRMISQPVPYSEQLLPVTPYAFGAWLGDGYSASGTICGIDEEVFDNVITEGNTVKSFSYDDAAHRNIPLKKVVFNSMKDDLKELGVLKTDETVGESKFIPDVYIYSSVEQRRALIAGMLDTDGSITAHGSVEFYNSNKRIIDGFRQVVQSLGYQATVRSKIPTYHHQGVKKEGQMAYTVSFFTNDDVFGISRKAAKHAEVRNLKQAGHRSEWRYIVDVQPVDSIPMACITVDSPLSLYLVTDAFIPTHNTSMLNALSGCIPPGERVLVIEDTSELRLHPDRDILYLQARPAQQEGTNSVTIRDLVKNALRMRPDRIVVGEVRDFAAYDMLQAMNTGHDGSMTTVHANDAYSGVERLVNLLSEGGESSVDSNRVLSLISSGVDLFVTIQRYEDGSRRCSGVYEIPNRVSVREGTAFLEPITLWEFVQSGLDEDDNVVGTWERRNELSESMDRKHRLSHRHKLSLAEIYAMSEQADEV